MSTDQSSILWFWVIKNTFDFHLCPFKKRQRGKHSTIISRLRKISFVSPYRPVKDQSTEHITYFFNLLSWKIIRKQNKKNYNR
jgi:hypothetical protein